MEMMAFKFYHPDMGILFILDELCCCNVVVWWTARNSTLTRGRQKDKESNQGYSWLHSLGQMRLHRGNPHWVWTEMPSGVTGKSPKQEYDFNPDNFLFPVMWEFAGDCLTLLIYKY